MMTAVTNADTSESGASRTGANGAPTEAGAVQARSTTPASGALVLRDRPVFDSLDELLAGATHREPFLTSDSKSGNPFERVVIDGRAHVVKYVHVDDDFTIRQLGDLGPRALTVWSTGLVDLVPDRIDHAIVGAAHHLGRNGWGAALLMRDVETCLIPPGDDPISVEQQHSLLGDCAALAAAAWGWRDDIGLVPLEARYQFFGTGMVAAEEAMGFPTPVPRIAKEGWQRFEGRAPKDLRVLLGNLRHDVDPLIVALRTTPSTFLHGDWKFGNVGTGTDGRTILLDWSYPGDGPVCHELGWYLALNAARLPTSKDATVEAFRGALEAHGVPTAGWWQRQLDLSLLGTFVQFAWEKAFGSDEEFGWWCDRAREGAAQL
jgi:hypothetical protein